VKRLWSLIGLLLIVPWGKLVAAIGLIDLPGQVREWGSLLGFLKSTQITLGMAVIGLVIIVGANLDWLRDLFRKPVPTPITAARTQRAEASAEDQPEPDIWLQDAVCYAVHGRWLGDDEQAFNNEAEMNKASEIAQKMRELAGRGKYLIWGKNDPARLHQRIPNDFWVDNQIDFLRLVSDMAENGRTDRATSGYSNHYCNLKVNKSQTEQIWVALSLAHIPRAD
jgi:hypothetical protein